MADTKYSALTLQAPSPGDILGVAHAGTSFAMTVSSAALVGVTTNTADQGILFNNAGVVSTDSKFVYQYSTQSFALVGSSSNMLLAGVSVTPASTAASTMAFYSMQISGKMIPQFIGPDGLEANIQASLFDQGITWWTPTTSATGNWINTASYNVGTYSTALPTPNTLYTNLRRGVYSNSSASTNLQAGQAGNDLMFTRASTAGMGGFFFFARVGVNLYATSTRYLVGLTNRPTVDICTSDTNTYLNTLGFAIQSGTTSWVFYHSSTGTGTSETIAGQSSLLTATTNGLGYDMYIYCPPNFGRIYYRLDEITAAVTLVNSSVANHLPNSTAYMRPVAMCGNLNASNNAAQIGVVKMYIESDI